MGKLGQDLKLAGRMAAALFLTVLRIRRTRRKMMFAVSVSAMLFAFAGITFLDGFLTEHPLVFAFYWFLCGAQVLFMLLLATYDFAAVKGEHNVRSERELATVLKEIEEDARARSRAEKARDDDD